MKLSSYHYILISQCLFLAILNVFITSSESQETTSNNTYINYTESTAGTSYPLKPPQVVTVHTYDDGTILVSIAREIDSTRKNIATSKTSKQEYNCTGQSLEQILRLRIIQLDGTIKEIVPHLTLDQVNFCILNDSYGNPVNPISIYPLYKPFILINYVKASNLNDLSTYEDWGSVIDLSGNSLSEIRYGPSYTYVSNGTLNWKPLSLTQLNVNKKQGFFRLQIVNQNWTECQQYSIDNSGKLSKLTSQNVSIIDPNAISTNASFMITTIPLVTGDYAILSVNSSSTTTSTLSTPGGLYMTTISYNKTDINNINNQVLLYQITSPNVTFVGLYCDIAPNKIGYMCIIETNYNNSQTIQTNYMKIRFLTSESVTSIELLPNLPNIASLGATSQGLGMQAMVFGGYFFYYMTKNQEYYIWTYDESNNYTEPLGPFLANKYAANPIFNNFNQNNLNAANSIMKNNNTFILALATTSNSNQWSLIKIPLPSFIAGYNGYGNLQVVNIDPPPSNKTGVQNSKLDSKTDTLSITFKNPIVLSTGFITIYKSSDNTMRQKVQATMSEYVKIINDNRTIVNIKIIPSTLNQYGQIYYVQMDANFVRDDKLYEPLTGIDEGIVRYQSKNIPRPSEEAAIFLARLTPDATSRFKSFPESNKTEYFNNLLQDMAKKLPIRPELLTVTDGLQFITINSIESLQFAIRVNKTNSKLDNYTVPGIISDITSMIQNKKITSFAYGITNDLDDTYGFKQRGDIFGDYKDKIIPFLSIAAVNTFLYLSTRSDNSMPEGLTQIINTASAGLFSASHTTFTSIFSFSDVNNYPAFSITSKILWITPLTINIVMFSYIMYKKGLKEMTVMNFITIGLTLYNSETSLLVNKAQVESLFGKEFEATAKWRAIADVTLKSIPQLITQILYFKLIVTYSIIPFFTLCTTAFMIILSLIKAILNFITKGAKKFDNEWHVVEKEGEVAEKEVEKEGGNNPE
ncbi:hypothetical protein C2G38_2177719 [Gigaspora rosea]|uniref:SbsA Ig-like domain-containing protein n=1 Tax=Gigaspora rosea TaxID=44941 RepID=A0A397VEX5_9GLOM|nr:hypothetical protein C2G38_2177719 [Gigaspora rosea]